MEAITERPSTAQQSALPDAWVDRLFQRFATAYGTEKFTSLWRTQDMRDVKALWATELGRFTRDEVAHAVALLGEKHPSWPPTLFEFVALCRETVNHESAFYEAVRGMEDRKQGRMGNWSHRAVYWALIDVSAFDVGNSTWPQIKARWVKALDARLADPNLPQIPEPLKQLAAPERIQAGDNAQVDGLVAKMTAARRDARFWVKRILERKAAGDKTLTDIAYRMAVDSVNIK